MRTLIGCLAAALAASLAQAGSLEVYKSVDAAGRVSYTNLKPKHDDFDVVLIEYDATVARVQALSPVGVPAASLSAAPTAGAQAATLRVIALPALRLASAALEPPARVRRKAAPAPLPTGMLRMEMQLRSLAP